MGNNSIKNQILAGEVAFDFAQEEEEEKQIGGKLPKRFSRDPTGRYWFTTEQAGLTNSLEPGYYEFGESMGRYFVGPAEPPAGDEAVGLEEGPFPDILKDLQNFWSDETYARFQRYGLVYRRGILLEGAPGTGKSVLFREIARDLVENRNGVVFFDPPIALLAAFGKPLAARLKGTARQPILFILEEIESAIPRLESTLLQLLDGHLTVPGAVYLASTNHLRKLPPRLVQRPSRFARVVHVGLPNEAARREFFLKRIAKEDLDKIKDRDIDKLVRLTKGLSIDHMKDLITSVFCLGMTPEDAVARFPKGQQKAGIG